MEIKEVKEEALERMKLLKLHSNVINEFKSENKLNRSELGIGILYWLTDEEQEIVKEFEEKNKGYLVYHVIKTNSIDFGVVYDLLYVAPYEEDWPIERKSLEDNLVIAHSITPFAESGLIQIQCINGGLARVG